MLSYISFMVLNYANHLKLKTNDKTDFGKAKWFTTKYQTIKYQKSTQYHGFIINTKHDKKNLTFNVHNNTHNLVIAGIRSGKTRGIILPTIQVNSQSFFSEKD